MIRATVNRGSAEAYGSCWTNRIAERSARRRRSGSADQGRPCSSTSPASGRDRPITIRASVVLPEPDSPTTPSASPARRVNPTSSRALGPPGAKDLTSPRPVSTGGPSSALGTSGGDWTGRAGGRPEGTASSSIRVYGCSGADSTRPTGPLSTTSPRRSTSTRSAN